MRKRRVQPEHPAPEERGAIRKILAWLLQQELAFVILGGLLFAVVALLPEVLGLFVAPAAYFKVLAAAWGFGMFLFVVVATDENPRYAKRRGVIRVACGAVVGAGFALAIAAPLAGIALGLGIGALLGYFGPHWVYAL